MNQVETWHRERHQVKKIRTCMLGIPDRLTVHLAQWSSFRCRSQTEVQLSRLQFKFFRLLHYVEIDIFAIRTWPWILLANLNLRCIIIVNYIVTRTSISDQAATKLTKLHHKSSLSSVYLKKSSFVDLFMKANIRAHVSQHLIDNAYDIFSHWFNKLRLVAFIRDVISIKNL